jgi:putative glutamine amidotransferase
LSFEKLKKGSVIMRPNIGIFGDVNAEQDATTQRAYTRAIERSGGVPILLPYVENGEVIEQFAELCDGFLFTGGADIEPKRYGEQTKDTCGEIEYYRDALEFKALEIARRTSKPILGICRGLQLINVAFGGTLYQDIPSEVETQIRHLQSEPKFSFSHDVIVLEGSPLYRLMGKNRLCANSFHHQAIKSLGEGLEIMALADDDIIEAVCLSWDRYLRAYQWHPERLYENDADSRLIFDDFIEACLV